MDNIFEKATKGKIRFEYKGLLSVEDLWDLGVEELDLIFKKLCIENKQVSEESLLEVKTTENTLLSTKVKIIRHIVQYKLDLSQKQLDRKEKAEKKEKIMSILASKQDNALEGMSEEELKNMLNGL